VLASEACVIALALESFVVVLALESFVVVLALESFVVVLALEAFVVLFCRKFLRNSKKNIFLWTVFENLLKTSVTQSVISRNS
jgi:hypothetical protein